MTENKTTFYFAKYEVTGSFADLADYGTDREERVRDAIIEYMREGAKDPVIEEEDEQWRFGEIDPGPNTVTGQFGVRYPEKLDDYNEEAQKYIEDEHLTTTADYSMFLLHFPENILVYNAAGKRIRYKNFIEKFAAGFSEYHTNDSGETGNVNMNIFPIQNTGDLAEVIENSQVNRAEFKLRPSNPSPSPEWEDLDDSIQEMLAEYLELAAEAEDGKGGLDMDEDLLRQAAEMAQTDYGLDYEVSYIEDRLEKKLTKRGEVVTEEEEKPSEISDLKSKVNKFVRIATSYLND